MMLASYKSTRPGLQGLANVAIRARLRSPYSHTELVFEPHDNVGLLMPDGTDAASPSGALWCASSVAAERLPAHSPRRAGKVGGVRLKRIKLDPARWDTRVISGSPTQAARWFCDHAGELYDWQLISKFVAWAIPHKNSRWTCSEAVAAALGVPEAWRFDPASLEAALGAWARRATHKKKTGDCTRC
jgi:hypothetical protein